MSWHRGRHRKSTRPVRAIAPGITAATAALGMILPATTANAVVIPEPSSGVDHPDLTSITALIQRYVPKHQASETLVVHSGDTLGSIAAKSCGNPKYWTGLYRDNQKVIGGNPDVILPGQKLRKSCHEAVIHRPKITVAVDIQPQGKHHRISGSVSGGNLSFAGLERLWVAAGGDSWAAASAASVAECESGGRQYAYNPSGASGYWQILGEVVPGNVYDPMVNARNAVAKWRASGKTFAQWVCKP